MPPRDGAECSQLPADSKVTGPSLVLCFSPPARTLFDCSWLKWRTDGGQTGLQVPEDMEGKPDPRCNKCRKAYKAGIVTSLRTYSLPQELLQVHTQCRKRLTAGGANPFGDDVYLCNVTSCNTLSNEEVPLMSSQLLSVRIPLRVKTGPRSRSLPKKKKTKYKPR